MAIFLLFLLFFSKIRQLKISLFCFSFETLYAILDQRGDKMGFFKRLMRGLGIETEGSEKKQKTATTNDKYANFNMHERPVGQESNSYSNDVINGFNLGTGMPNLIIQKPKIYFNIIMIQIAYQKVYYQVLYII